MLNLTTLKYRRKRGDLIHVFKILNGHYDINWEDFFTLDTNRTHNTRGHSKKMVKDIYSCPIKIIKGLTVKGQFQYITKLKMRQEGTYLYTTQVLSLR